MRVQGQTSILRRWLECLGAILAGNAIYYYALAPHLPEAWQHQIFRIDPGLMADFLVCLGVYSLIRLFRGL